MISGTKSAFENRGNITFTDLDFFRLTRRVETKVDKTDW